MPKLQTQMTGWRLQVRYWLQIIRDHQLRPYLAEFRRSASEMQSDFPRALLPVLAAHIYRPLATWLVKAALKDAASDLGVTLDDPTLDFLADLAVDALLATA